MKTQACVEICPEIFEMDGSAATAKVGIVPDRLVDICRAASEACPSCAIIVED